MEILWQDADNPARASVEEDRFFENFRVAREFSLPESVSNDDGQGRAEFGFVGEESSAEDWIYFEHVEKICRCARGIDAHGALVELKRLRLPDSSHGGVGVENLVVAGPVEIVPRRDKVEILAREVCRDGYQAVAVEIRERLQENCVDHAENSGGRADSEAERENRGDAEARVAEQGAKGESEIGKK